uniref:SecY-type transporter protein n=1 Tax=Nitzschia sp. (in: diatoms) TaxID=1884248 RepID=A0A5J6DUH1_9STRA|nr:SecY-type transporter protein [Nitzschia sp. (in: diatoms)]
MIKIIIDIIKYFKNFFVLEFEILKNFSLGLESYLISYQLISFFSNKFNTISKRYLKIKLYSLTIIFIFINSIFKYIFLKKLNYNITALKFISINIYLILKIFFLIWLGNRINHYKIINGHLLLNSSEYIFKFIYNFNLILLKNKSFRNFNIIKLAFVLQFIVFFINNFILAFIKKIYLISVNFSKKQIKNFYISLNVHIKNLYLINFIINLLEIKAIFINKKNYIFLNFINCYILIFIINFFSLTLKSNTKNILIYFQKNNISLLNINYIVNYKLLYFSYHLYYLNFILSFIINFLIFLPFFIEKYLNIFCFSQLNLIYLLQIFNFFLESLTKIKINIATQNNKYKTL